MMQGQDGAKEVVGMALDFQYGSIADAIILVEDDFNLGYANRVQAIRILRDMGQNAKNWHTIMDDLVERDFIGGYESNWCPFFPDCKYCAPMM